MSFDSDEYKTDDPAFIKDVNSTALLSVDDRSQQEYLMRRKALQRNQSAESDINSMKQEIDTLKNDVGEIKGLLTQLIHKIS